MKRRILMLVFGCVMVMATFSSALTPLNPMEPTLGNYGPLPWPCANGAICIPR